VFMMAFGGYSGSGSGNSGSGLAGVSSSAKRVRRRVRDLLTLGALVAFVACTGNASSANIVPTKAGERIPTPAASYVPPPKYAIPAGNSEVVLTDELTHWPVPTASADGEPPLHLPQTRAPTPAPTVAPSPTAKPTLEATIESIPTATPEPTLAPASFYLEDGGMSYEGGSLNADGSVESSVTGVVGNKGGVVGDVLVGLFDNGNLVGEAGFGVAAGGSDVARFSGFSLLPGGHDLEFRIGGVVVGGLSEYVPEPADLVSEFVGEPVEVGFDGGTGVADYQVNVRIGNSGGRGVDFFSAALKVDGVLSGFEPGLAVGAGGFVDFAFEVSGVAPGEHVLELVPDYYGDVVQLDNKMANDFSNAVLVVPEKGRLSIDTDLVSYVEGERNPDGSVNYAVTLPFGNTGGRLIDGFSAVASVDGVVLGQVGGLSVAAGGLDSRVVQFSLPPGEHDVMVELRSVDGMVLDGYELGVDVPLPLPNLKIESAVAVVKGVNSDGSASHDLVVNGTYDASGEGAEIPSKSDFAVGVRDFEGRVNGGTTVSFNRDGTFQAEVLDVRLMPGTYEIPLEVNPDRVIAESNFEDNKYNELTLTVPEPLRVSQQVVEHWKDLAAGGECGDTRSNFNWPDNVRRIYVTGKPLLEHITELEAAFSVLRGVGYDIEYVVNKADANIVYNLYIPHSDFFRLYPDVDPNSLNETWGIVVDVKRRVYTLQEESVAVSTNGSPEFIKHLIWEETGHAVTGLCNDTARTTDTAFSTNSNDERRSYSSLDIGAFKIQAHPYLFGGGVRVDKIGKWVIIE